MFPTHTTKPGVLPKQSSQGLYFNFVYLFEVCRCEFRVRELLLFDFVVIFSRR